MLVLSRDCDTVIRIGPDIRVKVLSIRKQRVKLGVDAPENVRVWRDEITPFEDPPQAAAPPRKVADASPEKDDFSILVVEDDPSHAKLITRVLAECRFPQVTLAETGAAAIRVLADEGGQGTEGIPPQLMLLDLRLPDMSGVEVLRTIRADRRYQTLPVVMLSSERDDSVVADCLEAGANAFVNKSAQFNDFRDSVTRIANFWHTDCRVLRPKVRV